MHERVAQISEYESSDGVFEVNRTPVSGGGTNSKTITTTDSSSLL